MILNFGSTACPWLSPFRSFVFFLFSFSFWLKCFDLCNGNQILGNCYASLMFVVCRRELSGTILSYFRLCHTYVYLVIQSELRVECVCVYIYVIWIFSFSTKAMLLGFVITMIKNCNSSFSRCMLGGIKKAFQGVFVVTNQALTRWL